MSGRSDTAISNEKEVLAKALNSAGEQLGLSRAELCEIVDCDIWPDQEIDPRSKSGELGLLLIQIYKNLYEATGGDIGAMRHWMRTKNHAFGRSPLEKAKEKKGLGVVAEYLGDISAKA